MTSSSFASGDSDRAREDAKNILTQKKFSNQQKDAPLGDNVRRISDWLGEKKNTSKRIPKRVKEKKIKEQNRPSLSLPDLSGLAWVIVIVISILVIGALGYLLTKFILNRKAKEDEDEDDDEVDIAEVEWEDEEKVLKEIKDSVRLDLLADKAAQDGRFDLALRYRFRAGLLRLDKSQQIHFHPSTTNNVYQLVLNSILFNSLVKTFNDVTYGKYDCTSTIYEEAKNNWLVLLRSPDSKNFSEEIL